MGYGTGSCYIEEVQLVGGAADAGCEEEDVALVPEDGLRWVGEACAWIGHFDGLDEEENRDEKSIR